jgi:hypothetical protein
MHAKSLEKLYVVMAYYHWHFKKRIVRIILSFFNYLQMRTLFPNTVILNDLQMVRFDYL